MKKWLEDASLTSGSCFFFSNSRFRVKLPLVNDSVSVFMDGFFFQMGVPKGRGALDEDALAMDSVQTLCDTMKFQVRERRFGEKLF